MHQLDLAVFIKGAPEELQESEGAEASNHRRSPSSHRTTHQLGLAVFSENAPEELHESAERAEALNQLSPPFQTTVKVPSWPGKPLPLSRNFV